MARSPSTESHGYTNPEVRFERSDISARCIVLFGVVLGGGTALIALIMTGYGLLLLRAEQPRKKTDLPEAKVDADRLPPEPRLEAIDDVRRQNFKFYPPRALDTLKPQQEALAYGQDEGVLPIEQAVDQLAGRLPARKSKPPDTGGNP